MAETPVAVVLLTTIMVLTLIVRKSRTGMAVPTVKWSENVTDRVEVKVPVIVLSVALMTTLLSDTWKVGVAETSEYRVSVQVFPTGMITGIHGAGNGQCQNAFSA